VSRGQGAGRHGYRLYRLVRRSHPLPPVRERVVGRARLADVEPTTRVAVTLEQCWHRVPGGTATAALRTVDALRARPGLDLVGVAARHDGPPPDPFVPSIPVRHLALPRPVLYETWHALGRPLVESATGPVDVVHATGVAVPGTRAPLVVTVNDLAFLADPSQATKHGNRFFRRATELTKRRAVRVIVPSEATAIECRDAGIDPARIRVVPLGVEMPGDDCADVDAVRERMGLDRPYLLFVGTIEPRKNLAAVVAAATALDGRDVDLAIVGPDGWNEDLAERLRPLDGTSVRVRRLGFVADADLGALYAGCTAFCYPSLREGFGLPVLEAMAHGAPVVTSAGTSTEEVAGDAALLVDPRDDADVAAAVKRVVDDEELADDLRARGRARAALFPWSKTAELTHEVYREVVR
jgi:glycosyltransferase involved in cell wall biosynthesis